MNTPRFNSESPVIDRENQAKHVVIIGGGITGLSAAWYLQPEVTRYGHHLDYTILEASDRWGGKIRTEQVDYNDDAPFILEAGPDAFLTRKPWAWNLAQELGLSDRILPVNTQNNRTYVLHRGQPVPIPDGVQLFVPTQLLPFMRSPLFSLSGKLRAGLDMLLPKRTANTDETLANFVRRRLGAEMLDKLGEPLLGGVFNGDPEYQSMQATFPQFQRMEQEHGSLIRGAINSQRGRITSEKPPFISFKTGTHELVDKLVEQLTGALQLHIAVSDIQPLPNDQYRIFTADGRILEADAIILATPAPVTAKLLQKINPEAAKHISTITYSSVGTGYVAFRSEDVPHALNGFGVVIPGSEHRSLDGFTWTSSKWNQRAPAGHVLLRVFFGGPRTRETMFFNDDQLLSLLRAEIKSIFGISASPLFHHFFRWDDAYPQYNLGHLERVKAAEEALPSNILIAGSAYAGVGVPDCVRQGREAAMKALTAIAEIA
jgi:protoporphyrinogen/coproporphyrinogen III oxidase